MNNTQFTNMILALAGVVQAATLVQQFASTKNCDEEAFRASISSIYHLKAPNVATIYGQASGVSLGLQELIKLFSSHQTKKQREVSRYVVSIMHLEKLLMKDKALLNTLEKKLKYAVSQAEFFDKLHPTVISNLGQIYVSTVSNMNYRIHVVGLKQILAVPESMDRIRAILLAGIRSAVLWQQLGGNKWQFLFARKRIVRQAKLLLQQMKAV